jgi:hypothetical protein
VNGERALEGRGEVRGVEHAGDVDALAERGRLRGEPELDDDARFGAVLLNEPRACLGALVGLPGLQADQAQHRQLVAQVAAILLDGEALIAEELLEVGLGEVVRPHDLGERGVDVGVARAEPALHGDRDQDAIADQLLEAAQAHLGEPVRALVGLAEHLGGCDVGGDAAVDVADRDDVSADTRGDVRRGRARRHDRLGRDGRDGGAGARLRRGWLRRRWAAARDEDDHQRERSHRMGVPRYGFAPASIHRAMASSFSLHSGAWPSGITPPWGSGPEPMPIATSK